MAKCTMAMIRSAGGGGRLRPSTWANAFSFQSAMASADADCARPMQPMAVRAFKSFTFTSSSVDCDLVHRVRQGDSIEAASPGRPPGFLRELGEVGVPRDRQFAFDRFRFDARTGELWADGTQARLTPRAAAVLATLVERAEQLVTKQELLEQVWGGLAVGDDALSSCIQELRRALGDDARRPKNIETQHRRGCRLIVPTVHLGKADNLPPLSRADRPEPRKFVGRAAEMEQLEKRFQIAASGQRQLVFVTGEPGIGKSALVNAFTEVLDANSVRIALGQCLDHHGVGEPYLPLIEALMQIATSADGTLITAAVATHAPSWLALMPSLWTKAQRSGLEARSQATQERMLRELTSAIEAIAADELLVLVLEDVHWSDASTLDWLTHVAGRPERVRLLVLATFRPADVGAISAGLGGITAELLLHGRCHEIALNPLDLEAVEAYLAIRLTGDDPLVQSQTARLLLERTGGNPLFMVSLCGSRCRRTAAHHLARRHHRSGDR